MSIILCSYLLSRVFGMFVVYRLFFHSFANAHIQNNWWSLGLLLVSRTITGERGPAIYSGE